jgi:hypothetical protein
LARLTEELKKEKQHWESSDWKMNDMIEKWWNQMMEKETLQNRFRERMGAVEKEKKLDAISQIAQGNTFLQVRKSFTDHEELTAGANASHLAKAVAFGQHKKQSSVADRKFEKEFSNLENEWEKRRQEMIETRDELAKIRASKGQKIVDHILPDSKVDVNENTSDQKQHTTINSNEKSFLFAKGPSPNKPDVYPSAELSSIKLDQTLPSNTSPMHEQISLISPIKISPTKSEESPSRSVHFNF